MARKAVGLGGRNACLAPAPCRRAGATPCCSRPRRPSSWSRGSPALAVAGQPGSPRRRGPAPRTGSSDILLGWQHVTGIDGVERDFYVRQFRDMKGGFEIETLDEATLAVLGQVCAWTLARPMPAQVTRGTSRSTSAPGRRASAQGTGRQASPERTSTRRWRSSQWPTPTRTTVTTPRSRLPWSRGGCPRVTTCEDRPLSVVARPGLRRRDHDQRRSGPSECHFV